MTTTLLSRETALIRAADKPIRRHAQNWTACRIRGCPGCRDCRESAAELDRIQREAVARQNARRAAMEERW